MKANEDTSSQSVVSPPISTLQQLKKIAEVLEPGSYTKKVRRLALALRLTVALGRKLTGSVVYAFLDFALVPGSEAHTRLSSFVKTDQNVLEVDTASSSSLGPSTHLQDELEIYCYFIVLLNLIDQKKYKEAKECSSATIGRLKRENMSTVDVIASKLFVYYYLRQELADDLAEIRRTLVDVDQLAPLETVELAKIEELTVRMGSEGDMKNSVVTQVSIGGFGESTTAKELTDYLEEEVGLVWRCRLKTSWTPPWSYPNFEITDTSNIPKTDDYKKVEPHAFVLQVAFT